MNRSPGWLAACLVLAALATVGGRTDAADPRRAPARGPRGEAKWRRGRRGTGAGL